MNLFQHIKLNLFLIILMFIFNLVYAASTVTQHNTDLRDDNDLLAPHLVKGHPSHAITRRLTPEEDELITNSIKNELQKSENLSKFNINVKTQNGTVALVGKVDSDTQASGLIEFAQSIVGVKEIDISQLKITGGHQLITDMVITAKIKGLFIREKVFGTKDIAALNISVETKDGIVYLSGYIDNKEQLKNAISLIKDVQGVKKVEYSVNKIVPYTIKKSTN